MRTTSELLLTFLLNAGWQIALIAGVAALGDWLLGRTLVRYQHFLWVAALAMSFALPLMTAVNSPRPPPFSTSTSRELVIERLPIPDIPQSNPRKLASLVSSPFHVNQKIAIGVLGLFALFLAYRSVKLFQAWVNTRTSRRNARALELSVNIQTIVASCQKAFGVSKVTILSSSSMAIPATLGVLHPVVILPEALVQSANTDELIAAIGHELVHVSRRDYLLNLIYELIFLPLSFHPAAVLMKRRITQTRELRCDELVAERLLHPEVYARSLVQLAGSAKPFGRRPATITVGIADADILEVRIMSLLKRTKLNVGKNRFWLIAAVLLLAVPCAAAASFAFHLNVDPASGSLNAQEPSSATQEKKEARDREEREMKEREREDQELRERIEKETNSEIKAKLEAVLQHRLEERGRLGYTVVDSKGQLYTLSGGEGAARERELEAMQKAELARLARITMEQAIQIATSQQPGKVLESHLIGEHWEAPGKLAKDGQVLYRVVILSGDEANPTTTNVVVNALDGTILEIHREGRLYETSTGWSAERKAIHGGVLNGKATYLPLPEYPAIARAARASGQVTVEVTVDESGAVIAAHAVSGHPLLQAAAVTAARQSTFTPTSLNGEPVKVGGVLIYNFVAQ